MTNLQPCGLQRKAPYISDLVCRTRISVRLYTDVANDGVRQHFSWNRRNEGGKEMLWCKRNSEKGRLDDQPWYKESMNLDTLVSGHCSSQEPSSFISVQHHGYPILLCIRLASLPHSSRVLRSCNLLALRFCSDSLPVILPSIGEISWAFPCKGDRYLSCISCVERRQASRIFPLP